jgi:hypothetical protein
MWLGPGWQAASLVPWEPDILDYMVINSKTTHLLVTLVQKVHDKPFCVPFQGVYESVTPDNVMARYCAVVDGELYDGKRIKHITKEKVIADQVARETLELRNEYASLHGKYWDIMSRLSAAETRIDNEIDPLKAELSASLLRYQALLEQTGGSAPARADVLEKLEQRAQAYQAASALSARELVRELGRRVRRRARIGWARP